MGSGGARTRSGPPRDPNALRRERDEGEWVVLKQSDRVAEAPDFPLEGVTDREVEIWAAMWEKPQALMWELLGLEWTVAMYVRSLVRAESMIAKAAERTLVRQYADSLGLTAPGLLSLRWKIERDDGSEGSGSSRAGGGRRASGVRKRPALKVVNGGAVEGANTGS